MMLNNILQLKKGKREKAKKKGQELLTLQCSTNCAVKTKTSGQASLLSSSLPMAGAEHRMKIFFFFFIDNKSTTLIHSRK